MPLIKIKISSSFSDTVSSSNYEYNLINVTIIGKERIGNTVGSGRGLIYCSDTHL